MSGEFEIAMKVKQGALESLNNYVDHHYCPGCEHGTLTRVIAMAIDKLGLRDRTVMVDTVGCSVLAYNYLNFDHIQVPHGRAPAVASGLKRARPDLNVFMVSGDGDALAIGLSETLQAAMRGEAVTMILVNNAVYGMTGGQMAPTTLPGQVTTTSPKGRDISFTGPPVDACRLVSAIPGAAYVRRATLVIEEKPSGGWSVKNAMDARTAVENAFRVQMKGGFAFLELLSTCWVNWKMSIMDAKRYVYKEMLKYYPLGLFVDRFNIEGKGVLPAEGPAGARGTPTMARDESIEAPGHAGEAP